MSSMIGFKSIKVEVSFDLPDNYYHIFLLVNVVFSSYAFKDVKVTHGFCY